MTRSTRHAHALADIHHARRLCRHLLRELLRLSLHIVDGADLEGKEGELGATADVGGGRTM
jgi:hypothetical protein